MGWSIKSPNPHPLATLTEDGKKATIVFSDHEEDTTYEFEYTDDSCGTLTKTFTVKGCSTPPSKCHDCGVSARFVSRPGDPSAFQDYAPKSGYSKRANGKPYVIGYYKQGTCSDTIEFEIEGFGNDSDMRNYCKTEEFNRLWFEDNNVEIEILPADIELPNEDNSGIIAIKEGYTHFITASFIPKNTLNKFIYVHFKCKNPECLESSGKIDNFTFNQSNE